MNQERFSEVKRLFLLLRQVDSGERSRRLTELAPGATELIDQVEALLELDQEEDTPLETPILGPILSLSSPNSLLDTPCDGRKGWMLGSYVLQELLGEGGMGLVYLGEQFHPKRDLAIKPRRQLFTHEARRSASACADSRTFRS